MCAPVVVLVKVTTLPENVQVSTALVASTKVIAATIVVAPNRVRVSFCVA